MEASARTGESCVMYWNAYLCTNAFGSMCVCVSACSDFFTDYIYQMFQWHMATGNVLIFVFLCISQLQSEACVFVCRCTSWCSSPWQTSWLLWSSFTAVPWTKVAVTAVWPSVSTSCHCLWWATVTFALLNSLSVQMNDLQDFFLVGGGDTYEVLSS